MTTRLESGGPTQQDVARRLHQALTGHDALAVIGKSARSGIMLEHRGARFLDLQKQRVVVRRREQGDGAERADAADADHFDREIT